MFAVIAAVLFGIALLFALIGASFDVINSNTLMLAGLLFLALQFAAGTPWRGRRPGRG